MRQNIAFVDNLRYNFINFYENIGDEMEQNKMYELTAPQKSIWLTEQYYKDTSINNICGSLLIEQDVDLNLLNQAINMFLKNNDSFKLMFVQNGTELLQYLITFFII